MDIISGCDIFATGGQPSASQLEPAQQPQCEAVALAIWTESRADGSIEESYSRGYTRLPVGWARARCAKCASASLTGALITPTADEDDPNILCLSCGYWSD
jgi:hypothetical protein